MASTTDIAVEAATEPTRAERAPFTGLRPAPLLLVGVLAIGLLYAAPFGYLGMKNLDLATDVGDLLRSDSTWRPLVRTLTLATAVSGSAAVVGTALAWLTVRTDLPARRFWAVVAPLPLVLPSFVAASALLAAVAPGGMVEELVPGLADRMPDVRGFGGAWAVLTLVTFPYVYLPVAARLGALPPSLEESARLLGHGPWSVFRTVVLPQASPAIWAGTLLVFLYAVSDYGAAAALEYKTLTVEIFSAWIYNEPKSVGLGLLLGVVALAVVIAERRAGRRRAQVEGVRVRRPFQVGLGRWRGPAVAAVGTLMAGALIGPLSVLAYWAIRGRVRGAAASLGGVFDPAANTAAVALGAALLTVALILPVAWLTSRHRSAVGGLANAFVVGGFALPGIVVALSLVFWVLEVPVVDRFYQTMPLLLAAYAIHFGAQAMRSAQVAVAAVPRRLDDAARMLGAGPWRRFRTVDVPLMVPGLLAGGGLVLLSTMKELPATLLLRPTGLDTLATRIWGAREAARWADMGQLSLALVAVSAVLTWLLVIRRVERFD